jgi:hypothetical protein
MRVMVLPAEMGTEGAKARVMGTETLPETRSEIAMPKVENETLKQRSDQSLIAKKFGTGLAVKDMSNNKPQQ